MSYETLRLAVGTVAVLAAMPGTAVGGCVADDARGVWQAYVVSGSEGEIGWLRCKLNVGLDQWVNPSNSACYDEFGDQASVIGGRFYVSSGCQFWATIHFFLPLPYRIYFSANVQGQINTDKQDLVRVGTLGGAALPGVSFPFQIAANRQ